MNTETDYKNELVQILWGLFKDVHGVRPRGMAYEKYSIADLEWEMAMLQRQLDNDLRWEREQEDRRKDGPIRCAEHGTRGKAIRRMLGGQLLHESPEEVGHDGRVVEGPPKFAV